MTEPVQSPLTEASPSSIQELFSRDPFHFTGQDFQQVISEIRLYAQRLEAMAAEGKKPRTTRVKAEAPKISASPLTLGDLGL